MVMDLPSQASQDAAAIRALPVSIGKEGRRGGGQSPPSSSSDGGGGRMMGGGHRETWKWWRYHELSEKEILDHLVHRQRYDRREAPPAAGPPQVNVSVTLLSLFYEPGAQYPSAVDALVTQTWFDLRLIHNPAGAGGGGADSVGGDGGGGGGVVMGRRSGVAGGQERPFLDATFHGDSIWMPTAYFRRRGRREDGDLSIKVFGNGTVEHSIRCQLELQCAEQEDASDEEEESLDGGPDRTSVLDRIGGGKVGRRGEESFCYFRIEGVGHSTSELSWRWQDDPRGLRLGPGLRRRAPGAASALTNIFTLDCSRIYPLKGNHSCLELRLTFSPDSGTTPSSYVSRSPHSGGGSLSSPSSVSVGGALLSDLVPDAMLALMAYLSYWIEAPPSASSSASSLASARIVFSAMAAFGFFTRSGVAAMQGSSDALEMWRCVHMLFVLSACVQAVMVQAISRVGASRRHLLVHGGASSSTSVGGRGVGPSGSRGSSRRREAVMGFQNTLRRHRLPEFPSSSVGLSGSATLPHHLHSHHQHHHHHHAGIHHPNQGNGGCLAGAASTLILREGVGAGCPKCTTLVCSSAAAANAAAAAATAATTGSSSSSSAVGAGVVPGGVSSPFRPGGNGSGAGSEEFTLADTLVDDTGSISSGIFERRAFREDFSPMEPPSAKDVTAAPSSTSHLGGVATLSTSSPSPSSSSGRRFACRLDRLARLLYPVLYSVFIVGFMSTYVRQ